MRLIEGATDIEAEKQAHAAAQAEWKDAAERQRIEREEKTRKELAAIAHSSHVTAMAEFATPILPVAESPEWEQIKTTIESVHELDFFAITDREIYDSMPDSQKIELGRINELMTAHGYVGVPKRDEIEYDIGDPASHNEPTTSP